MSNEGLQRRRMMLEIDGCAFKGDNANRRVMSLDGVLRGERGKEERVHIEITPEGWQLYNVTPVLPEGAGAPTGTQSPWGTLRNVSREVGKVGAEDVPPLRPRTREEPEQ